MKKGARIAVILILGLGGIVVTAYLKGYFNPDVWGRITQRPAKRSEDPKVVAAAAAAYSAPIITGPASREEWPQIGGPNRNGATMGKGLPEGWAKTAPKKSWSFDLGPGYGGPAIAGGEVYILDRFEDQFDVMRCLDLETGAEKWSDQQKREGRLSYNGSRAVPTVTKDGVFAVGPFGDAYAYDRSGKLMWKKDLKKEFKARAGGFGISQSPLVHEGLVIIAIYAPEVGVVAFDARSGELRWKGPYLGSAAHASPTLQTIHGVEQVVVMSSTHVQGLVPKSGEKLWEYRGWKANNPIATPLVLPDGRIFLSGGYNSGSQMVVLADADANYGAELAWDLPGQGTQIHQVIFYRDHLYANFNTNENLRRNPQGLVCIKLDGSIAWNSGKDFDINRGPIMMAGGVLISMSAEDGMLRFVDPKPEGYAVLTEFQPFNAEKLKRRKNQLFSPMALSGKSLVVRSNEELVRLVLGG